MNRELMQQLEKEHGHIIQAAAEFHAEIEKNGQPSGEDIEKYEKMCLEAEAKQTAFKAARSWVEAQEQLALQAAWRDEVQRLPRPEATVSNPNTATKEAAPPPRDERKTGVNAPEYRASFLNYVKTGLRDETLETAADAPARTDVDPLGGYVVPGVMADDLIQTRDRMMPLLTMVDTITNILPSQPLDYPYEKERMDTAVRYGEASEIDARSVPALENRQWKPTLMANSTSLTYTQMAQTHFPYEGYLNRRLLYSMDYTREDEVLNGPGGERSIGVMNANNGGIPTSRDANTGSTSKEFTWKGIHAAKYEHLRPAYWPMATWVFHPASVGLIRTLQTDDGAFAWQPSAQLGAPNRLDDIPVTVSEFMPNTFTSGHYVGLLADFSEYLIVDTGATTVQRLTEIEALSNRVVLVARRYWYGAPKLEEAFVRIKVGNIS